MDIPRDLLVSPAAMALVSGMTFPSGPAPQEHTIRPVSPEASLGLIGVPPGVQDDPRNALAVRTIGLIGTTLSPYAEAQPCAVAQQPPLIQSDGVNESEPIRARLIGHLPAGANAHFVAANLDFFGRNPGRSEFSGESVVAASDRIQLAAGALPLWLFPQISTFDSAGLPQAIQPLGKDWVMRVGPFVRPDGTETPFLFQEAHFHQDPVASDPVSELRLLTGTASGCYVLVRHANGVLCVPPHQLTTISMAPRAGHQFCAVLEGALADYPRLKEVMNRGGELPPDAIRALDEAVKHGLAELTADDLRRMGAEQSGVLMVSTHLSDPPEDPNSPFNLMAQATLAIRDPRHPYLPYPEGPQ
jgi:hypothetical protein